MTRLTSICLALICGLQLAASCNRHKMDNDIEASCEGVICTMMFAAVSVHVQDAGANPVLLDSAVTINPNGTRINKSPANAGGFYTIVDDSYRKALAMRTEDVRFIGYKGGQQVVEGAFKVSADCCHVSKVSGPDILTVK